jgi:hypothetical protein
VREGAMPWILLVLVLAVVFLLALAAALARLK